MGKIEDEFSGYLNIDDDTFAYFVSKHIITLLPATNNSNERSDVLHRITSRNTDNSEYYFGESGIGRRIAFLRNSKINSSFLGQNSTLKFGTPIIIQSAGNMHGFYTQLTSKWESFHAMTFYGGNINAIYDPQIAIKDPSLEETKEFQHDGGGKILLRPWKDYTYYLNLMINGENIELTISISQGAGNQKNNIINGVNIGNLNSFIQFSFDSAQSFEKIEKYYTIARSLVMLLTGQRNIFFEVYLSQKNSDEKYFKTADCKISDDFENHCQKPFRRVIPIREILDVLPLLLNKISNYEINPLLDLLPRDNKENKRISITNIQDLCTALEVAYSWNNIQEEKDELIVELKKEIKATISSFVALHDGIDAYKETTLSSAFQYLDYTLKQKILALYNEHKETIDRIVSKYGLPNIDEENIGSFIKLRNGKTHSGIINWGNSTDIYIALCALVYSSLFKSVGMSDDIILQMIDQLF